MVQIHIELIICIHCLALSNESKSTDPFQYYSLHNSAFHNAVPTNHHELKHHFICSFSKC